jgi:hypothetical protein
MALFVHFSDPIRKTTDEMVKWLRKAVALFSLQSHFSKVVIRRALTK